MRRGLLLLFVACGCQPAATAPGPGPAVLRQADITLPGNGFKGVLFAGQFGHAIAVGDFNKDGKKDLAVGEPGASAGGGQVHLLMAVATFGPTDQTQAIVTVVPPPDAGIGWSLAVGDFLYADGVDDLAVGAPWLESLDGGQRGGVLIYSGQTIGPIDSNIELRPPNFGVQTDTQFGYALATFPAVIGGVGDGLVVGAPGAGPGGAVVFYPPLTIATGANGVLMPAPAPGMRFGTAVAVSDVDSDGLPEIAIGAPGALNGRGLVQMYEVIGTTPTPVTTLQEADAGAEAHGSALAARKIGPFVAGANRFGTLYPDEGAISAMQLVGGQVAQVRHTDPVDLARAELGSAVAMLDFNRDDKYEVAAGAPGADQVHVFTTPASLLPLVSWSGPAGSRYGCALAMGDIFPLGGDGAEDLVVGAELLGSTGAVFIVPGVADGGMGGCPTTCGPCEQCQLGVCASQCAPAETCSPVFQTCVPRTIADFTVVEDSSGLVTVVLTVAAPPGTTHQWDFGDLTPIEVDPTPAPHRYVVPGGFQIEHKLFVGGVPLDTVKRPAHRRDAFGRMPPTAYIAGVSLTQLPNGRISVDFNCNCSGGSGNVKRVRWDFSDADAEGPAVTHVFDPGTRRVRVYVESDLGLGAMDSVLIGVPDVSASNLPPVCRLSLGDFATAPYTPVLLGGAARDDDGDATAMKIRLHDDTVVDLGTTHAYAAADSYAVRLEVGDSRGGVCLDRGSVFVLPPPQLAKSDPDPVPCGERANWSVEVSGSLPTQVRLRSTDPAVTLSDGVVSWQSPPTEPAMTTVRVEAEGVWGTAEQPLTFRSICHTDLRFESCGCSAPGQALVALLALWAFRRRRR